MLPLFKLAGVIELLECEPLEVYPLHEELENFFGGVFEAISLSLTFNKSAIECRVQDFQMVADNLFMSSKLGSLAFLIDYEGDKGI